MTLTMGTVNTPVRPDGKKKVHVQLALDYNALNVANEIGIV